MIRVKRLHNTGKHHHSVHHKYAEQFAEIEEISVFDYFDVSHNSICISYGIQNVEKRSPVVHPVTVNPEYDSCKRIDKQDKGGNDQSRDNVQIRESLPFTYYVPDSDHGKQITAENH